MPILDFNDPNPAFGGGGGGGGGGAGDAAVYVFEIPQMDLPQEQVIDAYTAYVVDDLIVVRSDAMAFGTATVLPTGADTISGAASVTIPIGGEAIIRATGTSDFELIEVSPGLYFEISSTGGDEVELPALSTYRDNVIVAVVWDDYGSGDPVTVVAAGGDSINYDSTPTIPAYTGRIYFRKDLGNWQFYINSADGPTTLPEYAQTLSPTHVWFDRTNPFLDVVGTAHFVNATNMQQVPPIPNGVEGVLISNPSTVDSAQIASGNFTMHRSGNRSFVWAFRIHESDTWGDAVLTTIGSYADTGGLCSFRTASGNFYISTCNWTYGSGTVIDTTANILGKTVLVVGKYATTNTLISIRVSIDGGAWNDKTLTNAETITSTDASWGLGYNNSYAGQVAHFFAAFWNGWNAYNNADSFKNIIWP